MTTPRACSPGTCSVTPYHGLEVYYIKSLGCPVILFLKKEWHNQGNICQSIEWELILDVFWTKYFYWNDRVDTGPHTKIMGSLKNDGHDSDHSRVTSMNSGLISRHVFSWVWSWKESPMRWKYSHENTNLASEWTGDALWSLDVGLKNTNLNQLDISKWRIQGVMNLGVMLKELCPPVLGISGVMNLTKPFPE